MKNIKIYLNLFCLIFTWHLTIGVDIVRNKRSIFIAEGTNWCGPGHNAKNCFDFGNLEETDKCCQAHDYCPMTYSKHNPKYNGFHSKGLFTLSHCECDQKFYECLNEKPYKAGSNFIWSTYGDSLQVKCFAYLPCSSKVFESETSTRKTGVCFENLQVMVFDSIHDYNDFIEHNVEKEQILILRELMLRSNKLMTERKKNAMCNFKFVNYTADLIDSLSRRFYKTPSDFKHFEQNPDTPSMETDELVNNATLQALSMEEERTTVANVHTTESTSKRYFKLFKAVWKNLMSSDMDA